MTTKKGVWNLQQVRDKQLQSLWDYDTSAYSLWAWGYNEYGSLGQSEASGIKRDSPTQIPGTDWTLVAGSGNGARHQLAIKTDGTLWAWGRNEHGQLGLGNKTYYSSPVQIPGTTWNYVVVDWAFAAATKTDGTLWSWGRNNYGMLGHNNKTDYSSPKQIPGTTWGTTADKLATDDYGIKAIKTDGTLWMIGGNQEGTLGNNQPTNSHRSSPIQIPGTWTHVSGSGQMSYNSSAIKAGGYLFTWGQNDKGQLGHNNRTSRSSPVMVSGQFWNGFGSGQKTMFATKTDGTLWSWGYNPSGQLGLNDRTQRSSPTQLPGTTWTVGGVSGSYMGATILSKTDGTLWTVGSGGDNGILGAGLGNNARRSSPVQITGTDWKSAYGSVSMTYGNGYALRKL
tara:strand:+ start:34 stop:1218 length:1185 start_codon:yes stop_codon:yes gene_type:complete